MANGDGYLGIDTWEPGGYVNEADAKVQEFYTRQGIAQPALRYAHDFPYDGRQVGDENHNGNLFAYIPTEYELGAVVALRNMMEVSGGQTPVQVDDPQQNQLLQSLYAQTAAFWEDIRAASGTV